MGNDGYMDWGFNSLRHVLLRLKDCDETKISLR